MTMETKHVAVAGYAGYTALATPIAETRRTERPRYGMAADGYTTRAGAPTGLMVRLEGETRFRRLMVWQFSNSGTCFLRTKGRCVVVCETDIPCDA